MPTPRCSLGNFQACNDLNSVFIPYHNYTKRFSKTQNGYHKTPN